MNDVSETNMMFEVRQSSPEYWEGYKHRKSLWRSPGIAHTWKTTLERLDNPEPHHIVCTCWNLYPRAQSKDKISIHPSIHFLPQLPSCWSLFQVEHKTNLKKFFNATMILSLFQALGTICIYPQVEVKEASSTLVSLKYWTETYLSLLLLATDNAGALPWHVSQLASGKRRPLRSLSTERDKRYRLHITYQFIVFQHFVYLLAISSPTPFFFLT